MYDDDGNDIYRKENGILCCTLGTMINKLMMFMVLLLITMPMIIVLMISMTETLRQGEVMVVVMTIQLYKELLGCTAITKGKQRFPSVHRS